MMSISLPQKKGDPIVVAQDEQPRADTNLDALSKLKAAFRKDGSVTAGNSSTLNDGAAALLVVSRAFARAHGLRGRAVVRGAASAGVNPRTMGIGPVPATQKLLQRHNLQVNDIDRMELNEAFAAQSLAVVRGLQMSDSFVEERINVRGGAIAIGHPLGCSGARIATGLMHILEDDQKELGVASLCVGVGQGLSVLLSREGV
jgi:acetyl-CoA acetyltransferase family protein